MYLCMYINSPCSYGENVPASMLIYGSIFMDVTSKPQDLSSVPKEEAMTPLPTPLITPPVTKMYFILITVHVKIKYGMCQLLDRLNTRHL